MLFITSYTSDVFELSHLTSNWFLDHSVIRSINHYDRCHWLTFEQVISLVEIQICKCENTQSRKNLNMENFKIFGFHISKLIVVIFLITLSECFPNYQNRIPNSNRVPNPCTSDTSDTWAAVGHWGPNRGGPRNPFGRVSFYLYQ